MAGQRGLPIGWGVIVVGGLLASAPAQAQQEVCIPAAREFVRAGLLSGAIAPRAACSVLANTLVTDSLQGSSLVDSIQAGFRQNAVAPRDLQSSMSETFATGGSVAQTSAVPAVRPVGLAAGSLVAVGTQAGTGALASLSVNPLVSFFLEEGADSLQAALARYARLVDVSAFFPVDDVDADDDGKLDYFGARVRVNFSGLSAGDAVWSKADSLFQEILDVDARLVNDIRDAMLAMTDPAAVTACASTILTQQIDSIQSVCGTSFDFSARDPADYGRLSRALAVVRDKADSRYWGLDLRVDFGDPTLGEVAGASGKFGFLGLAYGGRVGGDEERAGPIGYRLRGGVAVAALDQPDTTHFAVEGGAAVEVTRTRMHQQLSLSTGVEFRYGSDTGRDDQFRTNFLAWRTSLAIPVTEANSVTVSFSTALDGEDNTTPSFSIGADWGLLFSGRGGGG
jgi:hypothetical protein